MSPAIIPPVKVYAWGAAGMREATNSKLHPDEEFVRMSDYQALVRLARYELEEWAMAQRMVERRGRE